MDLINELGGVVIKIERSSVTIHEHISESGVNTIENWSYVLNNDTTKEDLFDQLELIHSVIIELHKNKESTIINKKLKKITQTK